MIRPDFHLECTKINKGHQRIAGLDEVGRGCWAGPVVAACVVFPNQVILHGIPSAITIRDSKTLSLKQRTAADAYIKEVANWGIGKCSAKEIDAIGISKATRLAMLQALQALPEEPDFLLLDGRESVDLPIGQQAIIDGDATVLSIAAASIIAKVYRDQLMADYDRLYPNYGFAQHVGYGTKQHQEALKQSGLTPIHRLSYKPIKQYSS